MSSVAAPEAFPPLPPVTLSEDFVPEAAFRLGWALIQMARTGAMDAPSRHITPTGAPYAQAYPEGLAILRGMCPHLGIPTEAFDRWDTAIFITAFRFASATLETLVPTLEAAIGGIWARS